MDIKTTMLDGKRIAYCDTTEFLVQVGRYSKGAYRTRYRFMGKLGQAVAYYNAINIGNGYKKRLYMPSCSKHPILARAFS
jgi:hypothetical protein